MSTMSARAWPGLPADVSPWVICIPSVTRVRVIQTGYPEQPRLHIEFAWRRANRDRWFDVASTSAAPDSLFPPLASHQPVRYHHPAAEPPGQPARWHIEPVIAGSLGH